MNASEIAYRLMSDLELIFGSRVCGVLLQEIKDNYLGEMDIETSILERPDLFERAFTTITGAAGVKILNDICDKMRAELGLEITQSSGQGELAKLIRDSRNQTLIDPV